MTTLADQLMKENTAIIAKLLFENEIEKVVMSYSGMGDSGNGVDIDEVEGDRKALKNSVDIELKYEYRYARTPEDRIKSTRTYDVAEALRYYTDNFTYMFQDGYEINEGGGGTVTIYRADPQNSNPEENYGYKVDINTYINVVTEEYTDFSF